MDGITAFVSKLKMNHFEAFRVFKTDPLILYVIIGHWLEEKKVTEEFEGVLFLNFEPNSDVLDLSHIFYSS
ncbi:hypothetical protein J6590_062548 [Homalodisca vitripennis]|nr:hypothetical protein J6590_062548 [Homalodisca vitripennis]